MVRSFLVVTTALVATPIKAQDVQSSTEKDHSIQVAPAHFKGKPVPAAVLASTTPIENRPMPLRGAPLVPPSAGSDERLARTQSPITTERSVEELFLADAPLDVRRYKAKPGRGTKGWNQDPQVMRAARSGNRYVLQVRSRSKDPWLLKQVRLEALDQEVLKVVGIRSQVKGDWSFNVVTVEVPPSARGDFPLLKLYLVGEDGRAAVLDEVVLP